MAWFLNVESYKLLAVWDKGVKTEAEWARDQGLEEGKGEEEEELQFMLDIDTDTEFDSEEENKKKRKQMTVILEETGPQPPL